MKQSNSWLCSLQSWSSALIVGTLLAAGPLGESTAQAEVDPKFYAVEVSAQVQSAPAQIRLTWPADPNATAYTVYRKSKTATSWGNGTSLAGTATSHTDTGVTVGSAYEYQISKSTSRGYSGYGYIYAGIEAPLIDSRGTVLLVVESTYASDLATELTRLVQDLAGDGWTVVRRNVSRNDTPVNVKAVIKSVYNADPAALKAIFLFGRVPVPYSGNFNPDGHPDHKGAWAADVYYGELNGTWTDSSVNNPGAERAYNRNVPGDGKFDQSDLPSDADVAVGRVDLANMTCFSNKTPSRSEKDLLRQYLNKHHNFRHNLLNVERRGLISDNFGERDGEAFAASGWRNFSTFFGAGQVTAVGSGQYFPTVGSQSYLWSYGCGGGSWYTCAGVGGSDDFALTDVRSVFTMFLGSYFGDWDNESNFLRAPLGSTSYTLASAWAGRPHWFFHHMALGEPMAHSTLLSQNNGNGGLYKAANYGSRQVHIALMGDPTLRMHPVTPPANLAATTGSAGAALTWTASTDSGIRGYHVYRGASAEGPFTRLTSSLVTQTSFADPAPSGTHIYMVRAVKLESSASGTYLNPSQGIFRTVTVTTGGSTPSLPATPGGLAGAMEGTSVRLTWTDTSTDETGFEIERRTSGSFSSIAAAGANATTALDSSVVAGTTYTYRVRAVNGAGASAFSNEATVAVPAPPQPEPQPGNSAIFAGLDSTTKGNWQQLYGADGYQVIGHSSSLPPYATLTTSGHQYWTWANPSTDPRAVRKPGASDGIAACWYSPGSFTVDVAITAGQQRRVALYLLDWDTTARKQTVEVLDGDTGAVLGSQTVSGFNGGHYLVFEVQGKIRFRLTRIGAFNSVLSGIFFGGTGSTPSTVATPAITPNGGSYLGSVQVGLNCPTAGATIRYTTDGSTPTSSSAAYAAPFALASSATVRAAAFKSGMTSSAVVSAQFSIQPNASGSGGTQAVFAGTDSTSQGNWQGRYGQEGYNVIYHKQSYPSYAAVVPSGHSSYVWSNTTTDPRALQQVTSSTSRMAACWYAPSSFTVEVNLADGLTHRVALYFLDWDTAARKQTVEVLDAKTGSVLNSQSLAAFNGGRYLIWDIKGHVRFRMTRTAGNNAVLMGLFFDPAPAQLGNSPVTGDSPATAPRTSWTSTPAGHAVRIAGQPGETVLVHASDDLRTWVPFSTNIFLGTEVLITDPGAASKPMRFYKAAPVQ